MPQANASSYPRLFTQAVNRVLANEGGYVRLASDPGGATKFGISQRDYPQLDISALTRDEAIAIYFRDFWKAGRYGELPDAIATKLFDLSINMGPAHAVRCLQRALRACETPVVEDGALGNSSIAAAKRANAAALLAALRSEAAGYYRTMTEVAVSKDERNDTSFLEGWLNRAYQ
jgi:lysozyme family protein